MAFIISVKKKRIMNNKRGIAIPKKQLPKLTNGHIALLFVLKKVIAIC